MLLTDSIRLRRACAGLILLAACAGTSAAYAQISNTPNTLYRIAGGTLGTNNGTGASAQFNSPFGIAKNTDGNLYVADFSNHTIRRITPAGVVTTFAGTAGTAGHVNGTGTAAQFNTPARIATDPAGNLYVTEYLNNTIRQITPAGVVTTIAGAPTPTQECVNVDGIGTVARFCDPVGIVYLAGSLFVADTGNHTIRKITLPTGMVNTFAGTAGICDAICDPYGITDDAAGNLYTTGYHDNTIRKITPGGSVSLLAGAGSCGSADGTGAAAQFCQPTDIKADTSGNLFVSDYTNSTVRKIVLSTATVSTVVGAAGNSSTTLGPLPGTIANPYGLSVIGANQLAIVTAAHEVLGANLGTSSSFNFSGFRQPVDNPPTINIVKAGSAVPVKFSLGGNQGLNIFAPGYPASQTITCDTAVPADAIEQTVTAGGSSLAYDATADQYIYVWKTDKGWASASTCRELVVRLSDGSEHTALFQFTK